jgi:peroxiredoxin
MIASGKRSTQARRLGAFASNRYVFCQACALEARVPRDFPRKMIMEKTARLTLFVLVIFLVYQINIGNAAQQVERGAERTKAPDWDFELLDANGRKHTAREWKAARAVALFFIGAECPISNRYAPELNRIVAAYSARGVAFYGVHSDPDIGPAVALQHAQNYGYDFPTLLDPDQTLAGKTGVILTPTAVILSPAGELLYRGRIDNRYLDFGKYRDAGVKPDLRLALDAVVAGVPIPEKYTKPVGCALPPPAKQSTNRQAR